MRERAEDVMARGVLSRSGMSNRRPSLRSIAAVAISVTAIALALGASSPSSARADVPLPRVGIGIAGGGFAGTVHGFYGGLQGRLGVQWTDGFATYVQSQGLIGSISADTGSGAVVGALLDTLMFEATIMEHLQVGAGPGLDFVWGCSGSQDASFCSHAGPYFSLDGRVALRMTIFTISLDVHPTWIGDDIVTWVTLGLGFDF